MNRTAWVSFDEDALTTMRAWFVMEAGGANAWFMTEIGAAAFARQHADEVVLANNIADRADAWRDELERATGQRWLSVPWTTVTTCGAGRRRGDEGQVLMQASRRRAK